MYSNKVEVAETESTLLLSFSVTKKKKKQKAVVPSTGKNASLTNLEIGHVVLQQSLSVADVLLGSHKHKGNHALKQKQRGGGIKS